MFSYFPHPYFGFDNSDFFLDPFERRKFLRNSLIDSEFEQEEEIKQLEKLIEQKKQLISLKKKEKQEKLEERKNIKNQQKNHQLQNPNSIFDDNFFDIDLKPLNNRDLEKNLDENSNFNFVSQSIKKKSYFDENGNKVVITSTSANKNGEKNEKTIKQIFDKNDLKNCIEEEEFTQQSQKPELKENKEISDQKKINKNSE